MPGPTIPYDASRDSLFHPQLRQTLFTAGSDPDERQIAVEACHLAYYKAETGAAEEARLKDAWDRIGFADVQPFHSNAFIDAQGFAAWRERDRTAIVAFRGTEPEKLGDLGTNLNIAPVPVHGFAGHVHLGFYVAYRALEPHVRDWLQAHDGRIDRLLVCGHSLGGAMAMVCAQTVQPRPALLLTIGCPRTGNAAFVAGLSGVRQERIVNCCDIVTDLPPPLFGYAHPHDFTYITWDGQLQSSPGDAAIRADRERGRLEYRDNYAWQSGAVSVRDLADHAPVNYARAFF